MENKRLQELITEKIGKFKLEGKTRPREIRQAMAIAYAMFRKEKRKNIFGKTANSE